MQSQHRDETVIVTKQRPVRNIRLLKTNNKSADTSTETVAMRMLTESDCETSVSDTSCKLLKSSAAKTAVPKNSGSVPVVDRSTDAVAAAAAAASACAVVIEPLSCASRRFAERNMTSVGSRDEHIGDTSRGRRRKSQAVDDDVEPDDAVLTGSSATSCKYSWLSKHFTGFVSFFVEL